MSQIANTILEQIRYGRVDGCQNGAHAMMCWGAEKLVGQPEMKLSETEYVLGGLAFRVNGAKFQGYVNVLLMGNDTYTIKLTKQIAYPQKLIDKTIKIHYERDDVYFDELPQIIDNLVESEGIPEE